MYVITTEKVPMGPPKVANVRSDDGKLASAQIVIKNTGTSVEPVPW